MERFITGEVASTPPVETETEVALTGILPVIPHKESSLSFRCHASHVERSETQLTDSAAHSGSNCSKIVIWSPAGASSLLLSECQGVSTGPATSSAPAAASRFV